MPPKKNVKVNVKASGNKNKRPSVTSIAMPNKILYTHIMVIFGASCNLVQMRLFPALWNLYKNNVLPEKMKIIGFDKNSLNMAELRRNIEMQTQDELEAATDFWNKICLIGGDFTVKADTQKLVKEITASSNTTVCNRLFYLALPYNLYGEVINLVQTSCLSKKGWNRVAAEKPFGRDYQSFSEVINRITSSLPMGQLYIVDEFVVRAIAQKILIFRFYNTMFSSIWDGKYIASVMLASRETKEITQMPKNFLRDGVIRDLAQSKLIQILTLVTMEMPTTLEALDVKVEKMKILQNIQPIDMTDIMVGQCKDVEELPPMTATYFACVMKINNDRWRGVPFILEYGKALHENKTDVIIQFKDSASSAYNQILKRNELIFDIEPVEQIYARISVNLEKDTLTNSTFVLNRERDRQVSFGSYENIMLDILEGARERLLFPEEIQESWRIFTPVLNKLEEIRANPLEYACGTCGPKERDHFLTGHNFIIQRKQTIQFSPLPI